MQKKSKSKLIKKNASPRSKLTRKKTAPKKTKVEVGRHKTPGRKTTRERGTWVREKSQSVDTVAFVLGELRGRSGEQSGDLQGLSDVEAADSESVDELLEEGNAFEADVVKGVEDAEDADEREVRTHEVSQDDVPGEYLDKQ
jgi:hypothetical protein